MKHSFLFFSFLFPAYACARQGVQQEWRTNRTEPNCGPSLELPLLIPYPLRARLADGGILLQLDWFTCNHNHIDPKCQTDLELIGGIKEEGGGPRKAPCLMYVRMCDLRFSFERPMEYRLIGCTVGKPCICTYVYMYHEPRES